MVDPVDTLCPRSLKASSDGESETWLLSVSCSASKV